MRRQRNSLHKPCQRIAPRPYFSARTILRIGRFHCNLKAASSAIPPMAAPDCGYLSLDWRDVSLLKRRQARESNPQGFPLIDRE